MTRPLFSIITAARNPDERIYRTIESIRVQRHFGVEHILIEWRARDDPVRTSDRLRTCFDTVICEPDTGIADAWNKGVQVATGELLAFCNCDDYYGADSFRMVEASYRGTSGNAILHGDMCWDFGGRMYRAKPFDFAPLMAQFLVFMPFFYPSTFIPMRVFREVGLFDTSYAIAMDYDLLLRAHLAGWSFEYIGAPLAYFSAGGISDRHRYLGQREIYQSLRRHGMNGALAVGGYAAMCLAHWLLGPVLRRWRALWARAIYVDQ